MRSIALLLLSASPALAYKAGAVGFSGMNGMTCSPCHSGGTAPTVMLSGPSALMRGQTGSYTFTITTNAKTTGMGAAATTGLPLVAGTGTQEAGDELVQAAPRAPVAGKATYQFSMTAPNAPGSITIWAAGLAANGNNVATGDEVATTTLSVAILSPPDLASAPPGDMAAPPQDGSAPHDLGGVADQDAAADLSPPAQPPAATLPGCSLAGRESDGALALPLVLLLVAACRRRRGAYPHLQGKKSL
jgi:hypothetical protein